MKKGKWIGAAAALALAGSLTVSPAMAFFTANTEASGVRGIRFGVDTELEEKIINDAKLVTIQNTGKSPCWVRARFFYGNNSAAGLSPTVTVTGEDWVKGAADDGWYYYRTPLEAPEQDGDPENPDPNTFTKTLTAAYQAPEGLTEFDIIVVYEYMPFMGEEDGDGLQAYERVEWKLEADLNRTGTAAGSGANAGATEPGTGSDAE